jgi:hypothetical protein
MCYQQLADTRTENKELRRRLCRRHSLSYNLEIHLGNGPGENEFRQVLS